MRYTIPAVLFVAGCGGWEYQLEAEAGPVLVELQTRDATLFVHDGQRYSVVDRESAQGEPTVVVTEEVIHDLSPGVAIRVNGTERGGLVGGDRATLRERYPGLYKLLDGSFAGQTLLAGE